MKFVFGGGGTGGHVMPALALADELKSRGHECLFIGNRNSVEERLCLASGYRFETIRIQKLYRGISVSNVPFPVYLMFSTIRSIALINRIHPDAVICTGGFVAGPVAIAAAILRLPMFFHESNSYPGLVTRIMARYLDRIYISFETSRKYLPQDRLLNFGIPLKTMSNGDYDYRQIGLENGNPTIVVTGGSQGSLAINKVIDSALREILEKGFQVIWQTGKTSYELFASKHKARKGVYLFEFSPDLPQMLDKATLAITRAGAMTIAELQAHRIPAILVPLPTAAENHQYYNAFEQQDKGVAILLPQQDLSVKAIIEAIDRLYHDMKTYKSKLELLPPNQATKQIVENILGYCQEKER